MRPAGPPWRSGCVAERLLRPEGCGRRPASGGLHCWARGVSMVPMALWGSLWVSVRLYGSQWVPVGLYGSLWVPVRLYGCQCVSVGLYGSLWVPVCFYGSEWTKLWGWRTHLWGWRTEVWGWRTHLWGWRTHFGAGGLPPPGPACSPTPGSALLAKHAGSRLAGRSSPAGRGGGAVHRGLFGCAGAGLGPVQCVCVRMRPAGPPWRSGCVAERLLRPEGCGRRPASGGLHCWARGVSMVPMALWGSLWVSVRLYGSQWVPVGLYGSLWVPVRLYGCQCVSVGLYGSLWVSMGPSVFLWLRMD
ncbi:uncharacterized protein LOC125686577 [Lagopus muta]|uniref:uncharacterized protein LOC125686577 n=1 Tax=Lagopus muta TaxID=64668 RepID=UPI0020A20AF0|nr:uncharacterized protein LOC125686577 [Lagopus muta]